jgi:cyclic pyranopterin phosphate synthase
VINTLKDNYGRIAKKLRVSVTDRCNMKCLYCMPKNNMVWYDNEEMLSFDEITRLLSIFVELGIEKIRITGGEPLLRTGIENLVASSSKIPGIKKVSMTTNGVLLSDKIDVLISAGLDSVNISLDTFKPDKFKMITGVSKLDNVLDSIHISEKGGLEVKINTVIIRGWNDDEIIDFANFARCTGVTVRFIEFMPLDGTGIWKSDLVFSKKEMIKKIEASIDNLLPVYNQQSSEPARLYSFSDGNGTIGFIPSITEPFCSECDRIRITSDGRFLTCLFENPGYDIKGLLRNGASNDELKQFIISCTKMKKEGIVSLIRVKGLRPKLNLMHTIGG